MVRTDFRYVDWDNVEEHIREEIDHAVSEVWIDIQRRLCIEYGGISPLDSIFVDEKVEDLAHVITSCIAKQAEVQTESNPWIDDRDYLFMRMVGEEK